MNRTFFLSTMASLIGFVAAAQTKDSIASAPAEKIVAVRDLGKADLQPPPLIVIAGKVSDQKQLQELNPADIESMEVYKGIKAVELYGSKAANGAIVVTMKKRKE